MNPSQTEYAGKDLVFFRGSAVYFPYENLEGECRNSFATIYWDRGESKYTPEWCNHPLLVIEESPLESNRYFKDTLWDYHTYKGCFVVCLNSVQELVVFPRDHIVRIQDVIS